MAASEEGLLFILYSYVLLEFLVMKSCISVVKKKYIRTERVV